VNNISITGRIGGEIKTHSAGCSFSVAVDKYKKDEEPNWFDVSAFGKTAEFCLQYLGKGRLVAVTGRMESRKHDGKVYWSIAANDVQALDKPKEEHDEFA